MMFKDLRNFLATIYIVSSVLIIAANLLMASVILYSPVLRKRSRNQIIVSIALADLLVGSFVTPMMATILIESSSDDCHTHLAVQVIGDDMVFFVVGWELVTLNILHVRKSNVRLPGSSLNLPASDCLQSTILVTWPWLIALCILVPLIVINTPTEYVSFFSDGVICLMRLSKDVLITLCVFSLYLPFYICVAALVTAVICYSRGCHRESSTTHVENILVNQLGNNLLENQVLPRVAPEHPLATLVPTTVYLACNAPLIVYSWLHFSEIEIHVSNAAYGVIIMGLLMRSVILPLSWTIFSDIRWELKDYVRKMKEAASMCGSNPHPSTASSVSFSRLQESQTA